MKWLQAVVGLAYPFLIFAGLQVLEARWVALGVAVVMGMRGIAGTRNVSREQLRPLVAPTLLIGATVAIAIAANDEQTLLLMPVALNLALLLGFARSLRHGPPIAEVFARMQVPDLPPDEVRYCRSVTLVWCGFFVANGSISAALALTGSIWAWTVYTGGIAYLLIGLLFAAEFVVRSWRFGRYAGTPFEPLFRRLFRPPPDDRAVPGAAAPLDPRPPRGAAQRDAPVE